MIWERQLLLSGSGDASEDSQVESPQAGSPATEAAPEAAAPCCCHVLRCLLAAAALLAMLLSALAIGYELGLSCGRGESSSCILSRKRYVFLQHGWDMLVGNHSGGDASNSSGGVNASGSVAEPAGDDEGVNGTRREHGLGREGAGDAGEGAQEAGEPAEGQGDHGQPAPAPQEPANETVHPGDGRKKMTFYVYRAQSDAVYPPANVNTADLGGVLWYLHNEIVSSTPRKYDVTRILRFKITVKNTWALYKETHSQFGPFVAFDAGRCTVPACDQLWNKYGFVVGCQYLDPVVASYTRQVPCVPPSCHAGFWYSLPGPCPSADLMTKSEACVQALPGGSCSHVTGVRDCTYAVEGAGEVDLNEFSFIDNYTEFIEAGRVEYNPATDTGVGFTFWDGKHDQSRCQWRMDRLQRHFVEKYPEYPDALS
eukprot:CAMPEP_0179269114 /NCGR_PEP_ID=MMETSP0797-20121207/30793_1 /TAXON_ID=47934 /ORGANISM="Dinophysis acuminata, Strain DAEP01" /LENGTH=425 /DNA_ID=CAMNT_0020977425 /DNA_START=28 /DNA_END=1302 /DNA_ORIENTATION=+